MYEGGQPANLDIPVLMLDNNFKDPDVERYLKQFEVHDPSVAVIGDAYTRKEAREFQELVEDLRSDHPHKKYIVTPKCRQAFEELDNEVILGYPLGYSDLDPEDFSDISDWRGRKIHILGKSPPKQWKVIEELTEPNLLGQEPSDIVGADWNGVHRVAYVGESWSRQGYQRADHLSIRETVRESLLEIKGFWQDKGVWPETEPRELYGPAAERPEFEVFMDRGGDPIPDREALENAVVQEYKEHGKLAFESDLNRKCWEYYEGLEPV